MHVTKTVDLSILPMTYAVRDEVYAGIDALKTSFVVSGVWDKAFDAARIVALMDAAGIDQALVPAQCGGTWRVEYDVVAQLVADSDGRLIGQAGVDPRNIMSGIKRIVVGVTELGFAGAHYYPHWFGVPPDHPALYPFYTQCCELEVPIQIQIGKAWQPSLRNVGHPATLDAVASDFPDLKLIAIHTGYPWERELIALASKHPNLYIGADSIPPYDWSADLIAYANNSSPQPVMAGRTKVLFGTNYPALSGCEDLAEAVASVRALGLEPESEVAILGGNATRVYGL